MLTDLEKCPRHLLVCEKSNFLNEKSRHDVHVAGHYFNYKVSVLIPECGTLPLGLKSIVNSIAKYYLVKNFPIYKILEEKFLEKQVKAGSLCALSYKTRIDQDNTFALLPTGKLVLSLDKDTYEDLGLEGQPSQYNHKVPVRYVITVDLADKSLAPGTNKYKRVMWALKEKVQLRSDFLMAKHKPDEEECPLASCFTDYQYKEYKPSVSTQTLSDVPCPVIHSKHLKGQAEESCDSQEFVEWLGAVTAGIECNNEASSFLSTYCCPDPRIIMGKACLCTVTGFLLPENIYQLLEEIRHYFDEPKFAPWSTLTVHGFSDSPVSWSTAEHGFHKGGENMYSFVIFRNDDYWLYMATGAHDACPP
ncbi:ribonuclease P protein subunit p40 [Lepisosteus oculatus]|uniref:ribonuclease P protein subunit p40 n=1 Tax=Lepisosteus oculatus TaxID=7918 RepID=UPI00371939FA